MVVVARSAMARHSASASFDGSIDLNVASSSQSNHYGGPGSGSANASGGGAVGAHYGSSYYNAPATSGGVDEDSDGEPVREGQRSASRRTRTPPRPHVPHLTTTTIITTILASMAVLLLIVVVSVPPSRQAHGVLGGGGGAEALSALSSQLGGSSSSITGSSSLRAGGFGATGLSSGGASGGVLSESAVRARARAAVLGALVADAATMGLHWLYDPSKLDSLLRDAGKEAAPEFFEPPSCPYYKYTSGSFSPYGDELLPVLAWLARNDHLAGQGQSFAEYLARYYKAYRGRLNKSAKAMMEAVLQGSKPWPACGDPADTQANAFVKIPPIVARYAGQAELAEAVSVAVRAQQNNDAAVAYALAAARVLERVVLGSSLSQALSWALTPASGIDPLALSALTTALQLKDKPLRELVHKRFGASCANPAAFQVAIAVAAGPSAAVPQRDPRSVASGGVSGVSGYVSAVRANARQGGDNASRAVLIGALLAAEEGWHAVPQEWRDKTNGLQEAETWTEQLLERRG